jgi:hypothetical protein
LCRASIIASPVMITASMMAGHANGDMDAGA